jgi:hypothetical protein
MFDELFIRHLLSLESDLIKVLHGAIFAATSKVVLP